MAKKKRIHVRTFDDHLARFWPKVAKGDGCWTWIAGTNRAGYGIIKFRGMGFQAHRFSWLVAHGEIPPGLCVLHRCDNPPCVNPAHLFLGTKADNAHDKVLKQRQARVAGESNPRAILSEDDVIQLRKITDAGGKMRDLKSAFPSIKQCTLYAAAHRTNWRHIP